MNRMLMINNKLYLKILDKIIKKRNNKQNQKEKKEQNSNTCADGLVGYDTALTRRGSRVQFPVCVMVLFF